LVDRNYPAYALRYTTICLFWPLLTARQTLFRRDTAHPLRTRSVS